MLLKGGFWFVKEIQLPITLKSLVKVSVMSSTRKQRWYEQDLDNTDIGNLLLDVLLSVVAAVVTKVRIKLTDEAPNMIFIIVLYSTLLLIATEKIGSSWNWNIEFKMTAKREGKKIYSHYDSDNWMLRWLILETVE